MFDRPFYLARVVGASHKTAVCVSPRPIRKRPRFVQSNRGRICLPTSGSLSLPRFTISVASPEGSGLFCKLLLGDVNLFFLVHVAQEEQKSAGAKNDRQAQRNPAVHMTATGNGKGHELVKFKNRAT